MAAPVNNIAATFATVPMSLSSSSSCSGPSSLSLTTFAPSIDPQPISASWKPQITLPSSQKSFLLGLYGSPRRAHSISTATRRGNEQAIPRPLSISAGNKLPNATLSYLDRNNHPHVVTLSNLSKGKKLLLLGVSAAFSPSCTQFLQEAQEMKTRPSPDVIACVAMNDVFVMRAWGEHLGVEHKILMLSDGQGELSRALGLSLDTSSRPSLGLGTRSRRFCLSALNGVIRSLRLEDDAL